MSSVPEIRILTLRDDAIRNDRDYVLYWMTAFRRGHYNFSLERAVAWAKKLNKPLVIFEALRCGYRWASDRLHRFIIEGMADNAAHFETKPVSYYPYLEPTPGAGKGLLKALADDACVVVSDDFPSFFLPRMMQRAAEQIDCRLELVDSNGLLPMRAADKIFLRAYDFRRFLQKNLLPHLAECPARDPLARMQLPRLQSLPSHITKRWPQADPGKLLRAPDGLQAFPIDHQVATVSTHGGAAAAGQALSEFLNHRLPRYATDRNQPQQEVASGLSPYLHFGHISAHEIFAKVTGQEQWTPDRTAAKATGSSSGWWGVSEAAESFLDELITWREVGYNMCWQCENYDQYESLPEWTRKTLEQHESDPRPHCYTLAQFESAGTHDELWNAAQRQLVRQGRIHNYLRMLWGKKILEWSATSRDALATMIELNNKYALDGRNPNSYSGIFWVLGRYDRPWAPERPIFGTIRYMSSQNTARKVRVKQYLEEFAASDGQQRLAFE
ncbi:MAG: deoxyribodipyrimidine photolyase [Planctomycetales bacterium]|nr:deoxyribodipyrimidine photolyase [Planctomycetales bacterium]